MPAIKILHDPTTTTPMIMLEYQGRIETALASTTSTTFGKINYTSCTMTIGNQQIKGRKVKLGKPFAVVVADRENGCFRVGSVITEKILFDSRPMTIMK